jgi:GT2 family glycosyltransferase
VASFASRQVLADHPEILDGTGDLYTVAGLAWRRHHGLPSANRGLESGEVFGPCGAAALYRRDAFLEAGGFDRRFFCYFEDVDLAFRLRLRGHRCLYVADAVVHHVGSALSGYRSDFAVFHGQRNLVWTFAKNMPATLFIPYLPHHLLMNLASIGVLAARGQGWTAIRAKWAALMGLPAVLRDRREIQRGRRATPAQLRSSMIRGLRSLGIGRREG